LRWLRRSSEWLIASVLATALAAVLAAALICWAPGVGIDEAELDAQQTASSVAALREERMQDTSLTVVLTRLGRGLVTGDLGHSPAFNRPVRSLFAERLPVTAALVAAGLGLAWLVGLGLALLGLRGERVRWLPLAFTSVLVCVPAAVFALGCAMAGWPASVALAAAVLPKIFSYSDQILQRGQGQPHRLMAVARGVPAVPVFWRHLWLPAWPEFRALAGVTLPLAIGAAIPVEVFTDTPGIGQMAWKAATGRDVMLLLYLTVLLTGVTLLASQGERRA
jgi:peptide/nickel transport system permease protein